MNRIAQKTSLFAALFILYFSANSFSQNVTGIWKGYFISEDGQQYRLEFQVKQNKNGILAASGVSYSWQDDIRFYGKATMTGNFVKPSLSLRIREIRTIELRNPGGITCIMNYDLVYSKSGREEFLEGSYLGKQEVKGRRNPNKWGDCGGGIVRLRKVVTSDFYIEPFLRNKIETPLKKDTVARKNPPVVTKRPPVTVKPNTNKNTAKINTTRTNTPVKVMPDTAVKINTPVVKIPVKTNIPTPAILKERTNELMKSLVVNDPDVKVKLYDNGEIDGDTISIYYDKKLLLTHQGLSASPIIVKLKLEDDNEIHELVMVAENLGSIPPNTALMIVEAGDQRFDVRITSTEQKNALVRFRYQKN
jgi:hypothetical protein